MDFIKKDKIPLECEMTFFSSPGAGGQKKNKTNVGVRLKHLSTGIIVQNEDTRSLNQNKKLAFKELARRLSKHYTNLNKELLKEKFKNNNDRIRTYNQKRGICIDHRTGFEVKIDKNNCTLEPKELEKIIKNLLENDKKGIFYK